MAEEAAFVLRIAEAPRDLLLYSVFADWLEDRGDWRVIYLRAIKGEPEVDRREDSFWVSWKSEGLSLRFGLESFDFVVLYAEGADGFNQFRGDLPWGLSFSDVREDVERKLGRPDISSGEGVIPFWAGYDRLGVMVSYRSENVRFMGNPIHHIVVDKRRE
jgi:uncharacterized protein (TIGR02996 family)